MKKIFYKIRPIKDKSYCVVSEWQLKEALTSWLEGMDEGQELVVSTIKMTEKQFDKLPEYEG